MAQAVAQHTPIDWSLDGDSDVLRYLTEKLGYEKYPALWKMEECLWAGQLSPVKRQLYLDGKPKDDAVVLARSYFVDKHLDLDSNDWVRIVPPMGFEWSDFRYTVAEQVVRRVLPPRPPAYQTEPDQRPEDKVGPDPFRTGAPGRPTAADFVLAEAERRIADEEVTPTRGALADFSQKLADWYDERRKTFEPHGPKLTAGRIENIVRNLWNAALSARAHKIK